MEVGVIGLGLIGGSLSLDLKKSGFATTVIGADLSKVHVDEAMTLGLVDHIADVTDLLKNVDLVILAIPVNAASSQVSGFLDNVRPATTMTDMGSTKEAICRAVNGHSKRSNFVASHPMAGTEHSGPKAAHIGLFAGKTAVICDAEHSGPEHLSRIEDLYSALKMRVVYMNSADHDAHAAYVSHLSHISSFILANTVLEKEKNVATIFDLAGSGFESAVRLAKSSPEMWNPIFEQNLPHVMDALEAYIGQLREFHQSLKARKFDETEKFMKRANEIKRVLSVMGARGGNSNGKT